MQHFTRWAVALCASASLAAAAAGAQEVRFTGFTNGCFGAGCTPGSTSAFQTTTTGLGVLSFVNATFDETTANGTLAFGGSPQTNSQNFNNFGSFVIDPSLAPAFPGEENLTGTPFTLAVTFTAPSGIATGQVQTFDAMIMGSVRRLPTGQGAGGFFIDFENNDPMMFSFGTAGMFTLEVADVNVNPTAGAASVTAFVTASAVPEPATVALFGTGLLLVGAAARRRARA